MKHLRSPLQNFPALQIATTGFSQNASACRQLILDEDAQPLKLRFPLMMTVAELACWSNVSRNSVGRLVSHFGLRETTGHTRHQKYPIVDVMRLVLDIDIQSNAEIDLLLRPLAGAAWVSRQTGVSPSTLSARALQGDDGSSLRAISLFPPAPGGGASRARRWIPAEVDAHVRGDAMPFKRISRRMRQSAPTDRNAFAALWTTNTEDAR